VSIKVLQVLLAVVLAESPAIAQPPQPIRASMEKAAAAAAAEPRVDGESGGRGKWFWPGVALGVAGATTAVLGATVYRVEDTSTGNAPPNAFQTCVAQKTNPIYATNSCDALKGKNRKLLWSGAAVGALGAVMIIGSAQTSAELEPGVVRLLHRVRF